MSWTLAITGKGGTGKTTLAALAVRWLGEHGLGPVLAVDADPNTCLDGLLGVRVAVAVGSVREEVRQIAQSLGTASGGASSGGMASTGMVSAGAVSTGGMGKQQLLEMKIQQGLVECEDFDLIAMGRPEGPGCYCYANNVLSAAVRRLADSYRSVVIDNEAGLENLSRRIVRRVDQLVFMADPSARGLRTARQLYDLAVEMEIEAGQMSLIINRARDDGGLERARSLFEGVPVVVAGWLPEDAELAKRDADGEPVWTLPAENAVYRAAAAVFARMTRSGDGQAKPRPA